ncbi:MAG: hypothetical protein E5W53_28415, partial [Mesorhizobium sp.]
MEKRANHVDAESRAGCLRQAKNGARRAQARMGHLTFQTVARISELERNRRQAQLHRFLDNFEISSAKIESIGPGKKQVLESYGVETALDVERNKLYSVSGFEPKTAQKLLNWRRSVEARFVFDPSRAIDPRD